MKKNLTGKKGKNLFIFPSLINIFFSKAGNIFLRHLFVLFWLLPPVKATAQSNLGKNYQISISKTNEKIIIDGQLTEEAWKVNEKASEFWEMILNDKDKAKKKTEFRVCYDAQFIYFAAIAQDSLPYESTTRKRDANLGENDGVGFVIDPLNQRTNGFFFWVSPQNVQAEDVVSANNLDDMSFTWDNKWYSATRQYTDHWTAEFAIPFTSLRYAAGKTQWGINFYRIDMKGGQYSAWTKIPININWNDFGYYGSLLWDMPPPSPGKNISLIPYVTGSGSQDNSNSTSYKTGFNSGFDAKVAVSTSLNLDLTVNPDFSQVDVDKQVTNLTRFNIFFPEKRTFFLENADLFSDVGYPLIKPFYSRTIGLDENGNIIPILGGARLSGNLNENIRIAAMNMQTRRKDSFPAQNYTAITLKRQVLSRSSVSGYFLNREAFMTPLEKQNQPTLQYGRNAGIEARYTSVTTKWKAFASYNLSIKPSIKDKNDFFNLGSEYSGKKIGIRVDYNQVGTNYYADMGFIGRIMNYDAHADSTFRLGFKQLFGQAEYRLLPKKGKVVNMLSGLETMTIWNPDGTLNDQLTRLRQTFFFNNRSELNIRLDRQTTTLLYHTRFTKNTPLNPGTYDYLQWNVEYKGDYRKRISTNFSVREGKFYNGHLLSLSTAFNFRFKSWGNANLYFEYNKLTFPDPFGSSELFLVSPRIEFYFTNNLIWTTFLQYNTQANNININSRVQFRYRPMSDIFLVYSDNYYSTPMLKNKNRAIVLKANYWLNL